MIKDLTAALNKYQNITNLEIKNKKKIIESRMKISSAEQEKLHKVNKEISIRIQNIKNTYKETTNKLVELEATTKILTNKKIQEQLPCFLNKKYINFCGNVVIE